MTAQETSMPTLEEARRLILGHARTLGTESVELIDALNLVVAEDIVAPWDMPQCDNSAMDGFAVRTEECTRAAGLRITGMIMAGALSSLSVEPGCAVKVMTGARIPPGADAVIPFEDAKVHGESVTFKAPVERHQHVRLAGSDLRRGEIVIPAGTVIRAPEISMMASSNMSRVTVFRRPRVAILSTGDELLEVGESVVPGKVVDSNGVSLAVMAKECGATVQLLGIARDTVASHIEKMTTGLQADIFITSAGVSVGERDLVRQVLADLGVSLLFHSVDVRPGGPTTFGVQGNCLVFCLPGNPVASMIVFEELVKPAILKAMGYRRVLHPLVRAILREDARKRPGRIKLLRVRLEPSGDKLLAFTSGDQATGMLKTLLRADGLAVLPAARSSFLAGEEVEVHLLSSNALMQKEEI
jgi:molybdopterin molybdotransferase